MRRPSLLAAVIPAVLLGGGCDNPPPVPPSASEAPPPAFGFGRVATADEIAELDIDVRPDGTGLPDGQGTVAEGQAVYDRTCLSCHGPTGREGPYDVLVGRLPGDEFPFATDGSVPLTVGNYWPHATTLFDYLRRAMPFDRPGTLGDDDVYALVALLLHWNGIIPDDMVLSRETLPGVVMPSRDRFVPDDRADTER